MVKLEKYTGNKIYMFPSGKLATKEAVLEEFPAADTFTYVVTTDEGGEVMWGMDNLSGLRSLHGIDSSLSEDEAIAAIEAIMNTPKEPVEQVPSAEERIAAALEYQVMSSLPDDTETTESEVV